MVAVRALILSVLPIVALAACGSDSETADPTDATSVSSPVADEPESTSSPSPETSTPVSEATDPPATDAEPQPVDSVPTPVGDDGFCEAGSVLDSSVIDLSAEPDVVEQQLRAVLDGYDRLVAAAPPEFEALVTTAQRYQQGQFDVLEANGFDFGAASATPEWAELGSLGEAFFAEFENVEAALGEYCGL